MKSVKDRNLRHWRNEKLDWKNEKLEVTLGEEIVLEDFQKYLSELSTPNICLIRDLCSFELEERKT